VVTSLVPIQQQAYQEQQQAWTHAWQIDIELWVAQHHDVHAGEQAALDSQPTELHRCKVTLGTERTTTIEFAKVEARTRDVTATINHEGTPRPTFARASSNVATAMALLDTLPAPSTSRVNKVYHQPRDILSVATEQ
jgi:hypothetical protein